MGRALAWLTLLLVSCGPVEAPPPPVPRTPAPEPAASIRSKEDIAPEAATGWRVVAGARGDNRMVAAAHADAARAGLRILESGGNALDASIAMAMVLTLVEPQSSGIGGGAFLLHWDAAQHRLRAYDGREKAPAAASGDMFLDKQKKPREFFDAVIGGLSVGVPGEIAMLALAHKNHGKLPWVKLFTPAIELAESGFPMTARMNALLGFARELSKIEPAASYFYGPDKKPKPVGAVIRNPELAAVLRAVAERGAAAFYEGEIAEAIVKTVRGARNPGRLTLADLKAYRAVERDPVCLRYRRFRACGMPPPTSGGLAALQIMGMLERFDLPSMDVRSTLATHLFAEASRLAFADRDTYVADPDFVSVPIERMLDPSYLSQRSQLIDPKRAMAAAQPGKLDGKGARWAPGRAAEIPSTSHLVAVDGDGNAVSLTASIEGAFGSHLMVKGFMLNNELTDFSFVPEVDGKPVANRVEPNKRPRSSMTPLVVLDETGRTFVLAIGSPGGSRIIDYVTRATLGVLDFKLDPQTAMALPHVVNRNGPTELEAHQTEQAWVAKTKAALEKLGHRVEVTDLNSGLHGILRLPSGGYVGGADPRREGAALGD